MPHITVQDGIEIYYKDWGSKTGQPIVFSHGWPLSSDDWELQMFFLANHGYRTIGHHRRGHGRSSQPGDGNNMDTYADDLLELLRCPRAPVLVLHGDDDQVVTIDATGRKTVKLVKNGTLKEIKGGSHGLPGANAQEVNEAWLNFIRS